MKKKIESGGIPSENLVKVNCYNCGNVDSIPYAVENGYTYVKCANCGLIYLNPRPKDELITKAHLIGEHQGKKLLHVTGTYRPWKIRPYIKILGDFYSKIDLTDKNWLDIGCGNGEFMVSLIKFTNRSLKVIGSEPNQFKRSSCEKRGLNVGFIDIKNHKTKYDYISLLNIYSHLPHPINFILELKGILNPGGELLLETGHTSHLTEKFHNRPFFAPDHLSFANQTIVEGILKKTGFDIIKTKIYRSSEIPKPTNLIRVAITVAKILLMKNNSWRNLFRNQKYPYRDMYIRARLP